MARRTEDHAVAVFQFELASLGFQVPALAIMAGLRRLAADDDRLAREPSHAMDGWTAFVGPGLIRCPGIYRDRGHTDVPCLARHGRAAAGSIAYIRVAGPRARQGAITSCCPKCKTWYELLCISAGDAA